MPHGPSRAAAEAVARVLQENPHGGRYSFNNHDRDQSESKRIARLAVAATVLLAIGLLVTWITVGSGSTNIVFAEVAEALDNLRTATFDETMEIKDPMNGKTTPHNRRPCSLHRRATYARCRCPRVVPPRTRAASIMILDRQTMKGLSLVPEQKAGHYDRPLEDEEARRPVESVRDGAATRSGREQQPWREDPSRWARRRSMGVWSSAFGPITATWQTWLSGPIRRLPGSSESNLTTPGGSGHSVMSNFRYDMELDPSLFSLEPPAGYTVQNMEVKMPVEDDLVNVLRLVAEHNDGTFPAALGIEQQGIPAGHPSGLNSETQKFIKEPEAAEAS